MRRSAPIPHNRKAGHAAAIRALHFRKLRRRWVRQLGMTVQSWEPVLTWR